MGSPPVIYAYANIYMCVQHLYGGIPPSIVIEERAVRRAADGTYLSIAGLVERQGEQGMGGHWVGWGWGIEYGCISILGTRCLDTRYWTSDYIFVCIHICL